jgi:predicted CXXCH cytochrome family protein
VKSKFINGFLLIFLCNFYSCSSSSIDSTLNFLFDGVPEKDSTFKLPDNSIIIDSTNNIPKQNQNLKLVYFIHSPYEEKMCESCHDIKASFKKIMDMPELCYQCHSDFQKTYKNIHYPVEAGECISCHHPHKAELGKLLLKPVRKLCADCHDLDELLAGEIHNGIGETDCTDCHNPHGSNESSLLK